MNTVHIWFNGEGVSLPPDNAWDKFQGVDALRTFLICADSWRRHEWKVKRMTTAAVGGTGAVHCVYRRTPFLTDGRVSSQYHWYGPDRWQYIAKCRAVAVPGLNLFISMDVINDGFTPGILDALARTSGYCMSFQAEHFSLSCFACTGEWLVNAEEVLLQYDRGERPEIRGAYVSDERILREYLPGTTYPYQKFASTFGPKPLIHFARSTLGQIYKNIPLS